MSCPEIDYKALFENANDGIAVFSTEGILLAVNRGYERLTGYRREELLGENIGKTLTEEGLLLSRERTRRYLEGEKLSSLFELIYRHKNGKLVPVSARTRPMFDEHGKHIGFQGIYRDLSEQKRAEREIKLKDFQINEIVQSAPMAIYTLDSQGVFTLCKGKVMELLRASEKQTLGKNIFDLHKDKPDFLDDVRRALKGETVTVMLEYRDCFLENQLIPMLDDEGNVVGVNGFATDETRQVQAFRAIQHKEEHYRVLTESSQTGVWRLSSETGETVYANRTLLDLLGVGGLGELRSRPWKEFFADECQEQVEFNFNLLESGLANSFEATLINVDGSLKHVLIASAMLEDQEGECDSIVANILDISERKEAEERLRHASLHDALTGLPNRELLQDRLRQAILKRSRSDEPGFALMFMDLDRFKLVNDSLGHQAGDELLCKVSERISECLRPGDTFARMGGDEFALLIDPADGEEVAIIAERILNVMKAPFHLQEHEVKTGGSIGIVNYRESYSAPEEMLRDADIAMYSMKSKGGQGVKVFSPDLHGKKVFQLQQENELRRAIANNQLEVWYQPITSLITSDISGFEALVRWNHPQKGIIPPSGFLPLAEESGLIVEIGGYVLERATKQLADWQNRFVQAKEFSVSVNVASQQFNKGDLVGNIESALKKSTLSPSALRIEVTETVLVDDEASTMSRFDEIKALGVQLSMDDFGTGYSSLSYLHRFPFDMLKIDRSFVAKMDTEKGKEIVKAIVTLSHGLGLGVVAEGIEEEWQAHLLAEMGCEKGQGFFFSKPMNSSSVETWLSNNCPLAIFA